MCVCLCYSHAIRLSLQFAAAGHYTLVVSTDPAHSLSDSLAQQVGGGSPVLVEGTDGMLFGMEIDPEASKAEFAAFTASDGGKGVSDFMGQMGLGSVLAQIEDLKLGELLDTPPPGLDEAIAITKVVSFIKDEKYAKFTRIVFDTAPTGHTLRLLSLPDFLDATIGKVVRLRQKIAGAATAVKSIFGAGDGGAYCAALFRVSPCSDLLTHSFTDSLSPVHPHSGQDEAVAKLEALKARLQEVKDLFRDPKATEFVIVTIPTVLAISESGRLLASLRAENVPVRRLVVNQLLRKPPGGEADLPKLRSELDASSKALTAALEAARAGGASADVAAVASAGDALAACAGALGAAVAADASFLSLKRKDQSRAMALVAQDPAGLGSLQRIEAPLFDLEIRGVPALNFFGSQVWT